MSEHLDTTRRHLGELGAMARKTEDAERRILAAAQEQLATLQAGLEQARARAVTGDDAAKDRYTDMVTERGRLEQVIARAHAALRPG